MTISVNIINRNKIIKTGVQETGKPVTVPSKFFYTDLKIPLCLKTSFSAEKACR